VSQLLSALSTLFPQTISTTTKTTAQTHDYRSHDDNDSSGSSDAENSSKGSQEVKEDLHECMGGYAKERQETQSEVD